MRPSDKDEILRTISAVMLGQIIEMYRRREDGTKTDKCK